jgi:ribonuclease HI
LEDKYQSKKIKDSFSRTLPPHIHSAFQKWAQVTQEKMASPLDFNPQYQHYWSSDPRDIIFGAHHNSLSSRFSGMSICHPIYDEKAMKSALRHAIYSAILNTEATATFMLLPASGRHMISNPYSALLNAYPHFCYKLGTIPKDKFTYDKPQSWASQETALPQHNWDLQVIAVWNTAARVHLNNQNHNWFRDLENAIPGAKGFPRHVSNDPIQNARHKVMPGLGKCEKLPLDTKQVSHGSQSSTPHNIVQTPCQSNPSLQLKVKDWKSWAYTDGSCKVQNGTPVIGAGVYHPNSNKISMVDPAGDGITNDVGRAELAAISAALTQDYKTIATDSLTSLFQSRKQVLYPEKNRHHVQRDVLKMIANLARTSQDHIYFYKVKAHAGIAGNECADQIAKYQATFKNCNLHDTGLPSAGPGGNPFHNSTWLAQEETEPRPSRSRPSSPRLKYLPDLKNALKSHMHAKHKLGYANRKTGYYTYYQNLLPHVNRKISNAFWSMPRISTKMKRTAFQYRTGTLYNQKHAVRFKRSTSLTCPLPDCHHLDSALHILSGCQCPVMRNMVTERHNIACRMILKEISEGSYGANLVQVDAGNSDRLAQHDLHIPEHVTNRTVPPYLFKQNIPEQARRSSSRPDAILVTPHPTNANRTTTPPSHRVLRSMTNSREVTRSTNRARQPHELHIQDRHIHLIEVKYCEDTRFDAQLEASKQQHSELCKQLQGAEIIIHPILLGVGGAIYNAHTLDQFRKLGIDSQRSEALAKKLHAHSVQYAHKLTSTRRAIENKHTHHNTGTLEPRAARNPPDPH